MSNFFRLKIAAYERRNNELIFDYTQFDKQTVQLFLDAVYKTDNVNQLGIVPLLKLIEFLKSEGKNMFSGTVFSSSDKFSLGSGLTTFNQWSRLHILTEDYEKKTCEKVL